MKTINLDTDSYTGENIATLDGYDGGMIDYNTPSQDPVGKGDTELEAVRDLLEQLND